MSSRNHNYGDGPVARDRRTLITPEGINLQIELADIGARIGAMFIDLTIMIALLILAGLVLSASSLQINDEVIVSNSAGIDGMIALLGFIWSGIFLFFPLFNKDRLRAGDLIAGTWVVKAPRPILAKDLVERTSIAEDIFA